ncbi:MAG: biopolymer transporter ExbD [Burkholderiales bacterium]|nr:MAG: biopolymer transporter ExbD [Burkholderiales bacterium]
MSFGGKLEGDDEIVGEINMVPMIDIMLVLLIIFIVTVPAVTQSVKVDLPRAEATRAASEPVTVALSVTADGAVHWNKERIDEPELLRRLGEAAGRSPQPEFSLHGDRTVPYERVARVMAALQRSGLRQLAFVIEPER